jgi:cGMP-dependent protein kinase 1
MEIYTTPKGECVFQQGSPASMFFIVQKGMVKIEINGK